MKHSPPSSAVFLCVHRWTVTCESFWESCWHQNHSLSLCLIICCLLERKCCGTLLPIDAHSPVLLSSAALQVQCFSLDHLKKSSNLKFLQCNCLLTLPGQVCSPADGSEVHTGRPELSEILSGPFPAGPPRGMGSLSLEDTLTWNYVLLCLHKCFMAFCGVANHGVDAWCE